MIQDIDKKSKLLVEKLLKYHPPNSEITLTLLNYYPFAYPYSRVNDYLEVGLVSEHVMNYLIDKGVIQLKDSIPPSNSYPLRPPKFIVSYNLKLADDLLNTISHGDFSWDKRNGKWTYKGKSYTFRPGTGQYRLINMFMENPNEHFTQEEIVNRYSSDRQDPIKRLANDLIKEIRKPLGIPTQHFIPGDGYIFSPTL